MSQDRSALASRFVASRLVGDAEIDRCLTALEGAPDDAQLCDLLVRAGLVTRWQAAQVHAGKERGFFLEHYKLLDPLGAGGMGQVFRALDTELNRHVAIKVLPKRSANREAIERFRREGMAALQVQHEHIVRAFELGQAGETHFLVMELIVGTNLAKYIEKKRRLGVQETARIGHEVALALDHAREQGIIHRDIKPSNIMLTRKGFVKLADLGLAKFFGHTAGEHRPQTLTHSGAFMGTVDYCAPEQAEDAKRADTRSDIYALGCTLYHCLTGQPPFPRGTDIQKIVAHREHEPTPIHELNDDVPHTFSDLIHRRMLAKRPDERFQTPTETAMALHRWISGEPGSNDLSLLGSLIEDELGADVADRPTAEPSARRSIPTRDAIDSPTEFPPATLQRPRNRSGRVRSQRIEALLVPIGLVAVIAIILGWFFGPWWPASEPEIPIGKDKNGAIDPPPPPLPPINGPSGENVPTPAPQPVLTNATIPPAPTGAPFRFLSYVVHRTPAAVKEVSQHTNILIHRGWLNGDDGVIQAARSTKIPVVISFLRRDFEGIEAKLMPFVRQNRDVIAAVSFDAPYNAQGGASTAQIAELGRRLKSEFAGLQYWVSYTEMPAGMREPLPPVPDEVDVIQVAIFFSPNPTELQRKFDLHFAGWINRAKGRPVVLRWVSKPTVAGNDADKPLRTENGTIRCCEDLVVGNKLAGVIFDQYGPHEDAWAPGIDTDPQAMTEIRQIARKYGFEVSSADNAGGTGSTSNSPSLSVTPSENSPPQPTENPPAPTREPGFVRFFGNHNFMNGIRLVSARGEPKDGVTKFSLCNAVTEAEYQFFELHITCRLDREARGVLNLAKVGIVEWSGGQGRFGFAAPRAAVFSGFGVELDRWDTYKILVSKEGLKVTGRNVDSRVPFPAGIQPGKIILSVSSGSFEIADIRLKPLRSGR